MSEAVNQLDMNFSNAGGGHTASVSSIVGAKSLPDDSDVLGGVVGNLGDINSFSNSKINSMMANFVCTAITKGADPVKKTVQRTYVDKTSLILESYMVLVRGVNCSPIASAASLDYEGIMPHFNEVIGSPLAPWPSSGPTINKSVIAVGKMYNFESAAKFDGVKITLMYQNGTLNEALSLNDEFVSPNYKGVNENGVTQGGPDLAQYSIKCGYTFADFRHMINMVGLSLTFDGGQDMPTGADTDAVLLEASGTLGSVISSIASTLGYYWYVNPETGGIVMINGGTAAQYDIDDETQTGDKDVVSASFSQTLRQSKIVNSYSGTLERGATGGGNPSNENDDRPRPIFFKRIYFHNSPAIKNHLNTRELAVYFAIFNQNEGVDVFDKFTYLMSHMNRKDSNGKIPVEKIAGRKLNWGTLWEHVPMNNQVFHFNQGMAQAAGGIKGDQRWIFGSNAKSEKFNDTTPSDLKAFDRIKDKFSYKLLKCKEVDNNGNPVGRAYTMPQPSGTRLYEYLSSYFGIAGGVYVSNSYSRYKCERMEFQNTNDINVLGPYYKDWKVKDIDDLSAINDYLEVTADIQVKKADKARIENLTVGQLAESTNGEAQMVNDWHFIAIRNVPKLEKKNQGGLNPNGNDARVDFEWVTEGIEMFEPDMARRCSYIGGPQAANKGGWMEKWWIDTARESMLAYLAAIENKKVIELKYLRSKTRVNPVGDDGEEAEDNAISNSSPADQKMSDLFDKVDTKYFAVDSPDWDRLNQLTLSSASGSTVEMKGLRGLRGAFTQARNEQILKSSSKEVYGLKVPSFLPTMNNISISVGSGGIKTTVGQSSLEIIPPDQSLLMNRAMEAHAPKSNVPLNFSAGQRNFLGV